MLQDLTCRLAGGVAVLFPTNQYRSFQVEGIPKRENVVENLEESKQTIIIYNTGQWYDCSSTRYNITCLVDAVEYTSNIAPPPPTTVTASQVLTTWVLWYVAAGITYWT